MSLPDLQEPLDLLEQKDFAAAVEVLERTVTVLPAHLGAHVLLAHAYEAQRRWERALEAWADAQFLLPNSPIAEAGKRRVLRRMDGIEGDDEPLPLAEFPDPGPQPEESTTTSSPGEDSDEREPEGEDAEEDFGLAELRRQAEREARQGGARPDLANDISSPDESSAPEDSTTPEEQVEQLEDEDDADDLDRLIDDLQSARIDPEPDAAADAPPPDEAGAEELEGEAAEEVVSETLARIHEGQGDYERAAQIYAQLAEQEPDRAEEFREKAAEMREKSEGGDGNL